MRMGSSHSVPESSVVIAPANGDSGEVRRNPRFPELVATAFPEVKTMYDAFQRGVKVSRDRNCLGYRPITKKTDAAGKETTEAGPFRWMTYGETQAKINDIGSGMLHFDMAKANSTGDRLVALFSKNRLEWVVAEQACHAFGASDVPLYDTLGHEAIVFILEQTEIATVFTDSVGAKKLLDAKKSGEGGGLPRFTHVVQFEDLSGEAQRAEYKSAGLTLVSFEELAAAGRANPKPHAPPKPSDLGFICYTSGTTGMPKGAMISHGNMVADASSAYTGNLGLTQNEVHLSYLPLAHVFERLVECAVFMAGGSVGFYQGDTLKLMEDLKELRPTMFPSVPRLYNRIYDKIMAGVAEGGGLKETIFNMAFEGKKYYLASEGAVTHSLWDPIVFSKVAARVGLDRCHIMLTGSAPIAAHVMEFLRIVFGCSVCEGYGQTECSAASTLTWVGDQGSLGHVGGPLACNHVKLVSVAEMGYNVTDKVHGQEVAADGTVVNPGIPCSGRGEVCYRGYNVFSGYYRDAEKTREALDADGWLHSGDIGLWDAAGNLRIIDRKKNIFKLSQGEYVAAEKIENVLIKSQLAGQAFVYGDSLHSMLVAIVTPKEDNLKTWAKANIDGYTPSTHTIPVLCARADVKKAMMEGCVAMCKEARLQGFEIPRDIQVDCSLWTPEDLLTPSFKLKRADAKKKYGAQIDAMYAVLDPVAGQKGLKQGAVSK